eukprot:13019510-Alexandrium_andersonii.AAC.1
MTDTPDKDNRSETERLRASSCSDWCVLLVAGCWLLFVAVDCSCRLVRVLSASCRSWVLLGLLSNWGLVGGRWWLL